LIQIHYRITIYFNQYISYLCCIISLFTCIYCTLLSKYKVRWD